MELLLDENVPQPILKALRRRSVQSKTVQEVAGVGLTNGEVVELARIESLIVLTFDKDFEAFAAKATGCKVILLDMSPRRAARQAAKLAQSIKRALVRLKEKNYVRLTEADLHRG